MIKGKLWIHAMIFLALAIGVAAQETILYQDDFNVGDQSAIGYHGWYHGGEIINQRLYGTVSDTIRFLNLTNSSNPTVYDFVEFSATIGTSSCGSANSWLYWIGQPFDKQIGIAKTTGGNTKYFKPDSSLNTLGTCVASPKEFNMTIYPNETADLHFNGTEIFKNLAFGFTPLSYSELWIISSSGASNTWIDDIKIAARNITVPSVPSFEVTAVDKYDSTVIGNFTVTLKNGSVTYVNNTGGAGSIVYPSLGTGTLYNLTINSTENGGYFTRFYAGVNVSEDFEAEIFQSILNVNVTDLISGLPLASFTLQDNYTQYSGTNGYVMVYTKAGFHSFNITSSQYPLHTFTYSIAALENNSFVVNVSPQFNFYLRREADGSPFDLDPVNTTKLTIYCPNKNIIINFKNSSDSSIQENITLDCAFTYMKIDVSYVTEGSYFRTLIPETNEQNVTWWLLDLTLDTGIQKIVTLVDLTGEWTQGIFRLKGGVGTADEDIIEQRFDVASAVTLYLLKDAIYTVVLVNNEETQERQIGSLIADTAGTISITYPNVPFYPDDTILENNISYSYSEEPESGVLRLMYNDSSATTTSVVWTIYNGSNTSQMLQQFTSTSSNVIFSYLEYNQNSSYYTSLTAQSSALSFPIQSGRAFGNLQNVIFGNFDGWEPGEAANLKLTVAILFLVTWGLIFSALYAGIGLASAFVWVLLFQWQGWLDFSVAVLAFLGVIALLAFISGGLRKT